MPDSAPRLILGSGSPRRLELLGQLGLTPHDIRAPDIDETPRKGELPRVYCERITAGKLSAVIADEDDVVLCADTTVAVGRRILGKPADAGEAVQFLHLLSGRRHRVFTALGVRRGARTWFRTCETVVKMKVLSDTEVNGYLATDDWRGKAGAYAIQGPAGAFVSWIGGSFSGVVGLPLHETANVLQAAGLEVWR
ncbi:Maf family protein [Jannaschia donghaensis]|uniref:dTTP/UTP pyrophosphatase n=1 Tax=Jannaschia donghaensis TaxID=420998 RepID=A0A0M6YQZ3_9RHOB|nr:Maf family protein [Jannaschia donghaensis]CTQ51416.1 Maf-like protein YhdE [Jannaschia donghaensis]